MTSLPKAKAKWSKSRKIYDLLRKNPELYQASHQFELSSPYFIPIDDLEAYQKYPKYNRVYNRLRLARWQGLKAMPLPIKPRVEDYPIIIKPDINLRGLAHHCQLIKSESEFPSHHQTVPLFWTTYHQSSYTTSTDLLVDRGRILMSYTFKGHLKYQAKHPGLYDYWEFLPGYPTPSIICRLIEKKLRNYRGLLNVECIKGHIIEAHLRMGDVDSLLEPAILKSIVRFFQNPSDPEISSHLNFPDRPWPIFLVPIFLKKRMRFCLDIKEVRKLARGCLFYEIDSRHQGHPPGYRRVALLTCHELEEGLLARKRIIKANRDKVI